VKNSCELIPRILKHQAKSYQNVSLHPKRPPRLRVSSLLQSCSNQVVIRIIVVLFYLKVYGSVMYQISSSMGAEEFRDHRNQAKSIGLYSNYANAVFLVFLVAWLAKIMVVDQYGRSVKSVLEYVPDFMVR